MPDLDELAQALLPLRFLPDPADYTGHSSSSPRARTLPRPRVS
jgi:hypothetical protein